MEILRLLMSGPEDIVLVREGLWACDCLVKVVNAVVDDAFRFYDPGALGIVTLM